MPHYRTLQQIEKAYASDLTVLLLIEAFRSIVKHTGMAESPAGIDMACNLCLRAAQSHQKKQLDKPK